MLDSFLIRYLGMNDGQFMTLIDSLIPGLYSFGYALIPDELEAEQLFVDAYSVFVIRESEYIQEVELGDAKERAKVRRFVQAQICSDMVELAAKRTSHLIGLFRKKGDELAFYKLNLLQRAALYMKENMGMSSQALQEILALKKHQVTEVLYNGKALLKELSNTEFVNE
tara:strand:+ start:54466 stop:54972 length:507 start_codon:yes stop_codon:yes gene_type:complete